MEVALEIRSAPDNVLLMFATEQNDVSAISGWHALFGGVGTVVMRWIWSFESNLFYCKVMWRERGGEGLSWAMACK